MPEQRGEPAGGAERTAVPGASENEVGEALRRTRLANERTYLAWWRTGMTAFAVSLGVGKLIPELANGPAWPFELVGAAFGVVGIALMAYAYVRQKEVEEAVARGGYARFDPHASLAFAVVGVILGIGTLLIILVQSR